MIVVETERKREINEEQSHAILMCSKILFVNIIWDKDEEHLYSPRHSRFIEHFLYINSLPLLLISCRVPQQ